MKIIVVDNGGQWTHREWRVLRDLGVDAQIVPNDTPLAELLKLNPIGIVLSGGAPRIGLSDKLGRCDEYIESGLPVLGICAGEQFMARHFGGKVEPGKVPEFGKVELTIDDKTDELLKGIPEKITVWASHNDEVSVLPEAFKNMAHSKDCAVQIMRHKTRPLYGIQFHPEVEHSEYGDNIFENFVGICSKHAKK